MKKNKIEHYSDKEALEFHNSIKSGKIEIISSSFSLRWIAIIPCPALGIISSVSKVSVIYSSSFKNFIPALDKSIPS